MARVIRFRTDAEGLAGCCCARDVGRVYRVAEGVGGGGVRVNTGIMASEVAPFGGMKHAGLGREGGRYGTEEFLEVKSGFTEQVLRAAGTIGVSP